MSLNQMIVDQSAGKKKKFEGLGSRVAQIQKMATGLDLIFRILFYYKTEFFVESRDF